MVLEVVSSFLITLVIAHCHGARRRVECSLAVDQSQDVIFLFLLSNADGLQLMIVLIKCGLRVLRKNIFDSFYCSGLFGYMQAGFVRGPLSHMLLLFQLVQIIDVFAL